MAIAEATIKLANSRSCKPSRGVRADQSDLLSMHISEYSATKQTFAALQTQVSNLQQ